MVCAEFGPDGAKKAGSGFWVRAYACRPRHGVSRTANDGSRMGQCLGSASVNDPGNEEATIHTPDEIAERAGRITIKTLRLSFAAEV